MTDFEKLVDALKYAQQFCKDNDTSLSISFIIEKKYTRMFTTSSLELPSIMFQPERYNLIDEK